MTTVFIYFSDLYLRRRPVSRIARPRLLLLRLWAGEPGSFRRAAMVQVVVFRHDVVDVVQAVQVAVAVGAAGPLPNVVSVHGERGVFAAKRLGLDSTHCNGTHCLVLKFNRSTKNLV